MFRIVCMIGMFATAPVWAEDSAFPNKPGKKPAPRLVVGAQSGAATAPPQEIVVGAGARNGVSGQGDYGLTTVRPLESPAPKRSVGYDPTARLGNKQPSS